MEEEVVESTVEEVIEYTINPEDCEHNTGINFCPGLRESGEACSHCAACGTQL